MKAGQVPQPHRIGNFKPSKSARLKNKRVDKTAYQRRQDKDQAHLKAIRSLPCAIPGCCASPSEAHHLKQFMTRGMGMKAENKWTLPLCHEHHINGVERVGSNKEHDWFKAHGIDDPIALAAALYAASPDEEAMFKVLLAHQGKG